TTPPLTRPPNASTAKPPDAAAAATHIIRSRRPMVETDWPANAGPGAPPRPAFSRARSRSSSSSRSYSAATGLSDMFMDAPNAFPLAATPVLGQVRAYFLRGDSLEVVKTLYLVAPSDAHH